MIASSPIPAPGPGIGMLLSMSHASASRSAGARRSRPFIAGAGAHGPCQPVLRATWRSYRATNATRSVQRQAIPAHAFHRWIIRSRTKLAACRRGPKLADTATRWNMLERHEVGRTLSSAAGHGALTRHPRHRSPSRITTEHGDDRDEYPLRRAHREPGRLRPRRRRERRMAPRAPAANARRDSVAATSHRRRGTDTEAEAIERSGDTPHRSVVERAGDENTPETTVAP